VAENRARLLAAGQHLKRGVLLYGPPGTGKTHAVRYLLSQLTDVTTFVLSGQGLGLVGQACGLARLLEPSLVVLEDVDLIAADRSFGPMGIPLVFEVPNQIDGLGEDVDVTFLLTTNRVDILERALSEQPGRVDVAVEIAVPDLEGRRRLFRLYGGRLGVAALSDDQLGPACAATEGRTATYIREVVRRAAMAVARDSSTGTCSSARRPRCSRTGPRSPARCSAARWSRTPTPRSTPSRGSRAAGPATGLLGRRVTPPPFGEP
jgi:cell division protease FtsH